MKTMHLLSIFILITAFCYNPLQAKKPGTKKHHHKKQINITVSAKDADNAAKQAQTIPALITPLTTTLATAVTQINAALTSGSADKATTIQQLKLLSKSVKQALKQVQKTYSAAAKTSAYLKPMGYKQAEQILENQIEELKKQIPLPARQITTLNAQLAAIQKQDKAQQAALAKAKKTYVLISNALGLGGIKGRLGIWGALKTKPTTMIRMHGLTFKKSQPVAKVACNPAFVYYIKLIDSKGHGHLLKRRSSKTDYFSDADAHHQLIVNGTHKYGVRPIKYKGPGSMYRVKQEGNAIMAAEQIAMTVATIAVTVLTLGAGTSGMALLDAMGISAQTAATYGILEVGPLGVLLADAMTAASETTAVAVDATFGAGSAATANASINAAMTTVSTSISAGMKAAAEVITSIIGQSWAETIGLATPEAFSAAASMTADQADAIAAQAARSAASGAPNPVSAFSDTAISGLSPANAAKLAPYMTEAQQAALSSGARQEIIASGSQLGQKLGEEDLVKAEAIQAAYNSSSAGKAVTFAARAIGSGSYGTSADAAVVDALTANLANATAQSDAATQAATNAANALKETQAAQTNLATAEKAYDDAAAAIRSAKTNAERTIAHQNADKMEAAYEEALNTYRSKIGVQETTQAASGPAKALKEAQEVEKIAEANAHKVYAAYEEAEEEAAKATQALRATQSPQNQEYYANATKKLEEANTKLDEATNSYNSAVATREAAEKNVASNPEATRTVNTHPNEVAEKAKSTDDTMRTLNSYTDDAADDLSSAKQNITRQNDRVYINERKAELAEIEKNGYSTRPSLPIKEYPKNAPQLVRDASLGNDVGNVFNVATTPLQNPQGMLNTAETVGQKKPQQSTTPPLVAPAQ